MSEPKSVAVAPSTEVMPQELGGFIFDVLHPPFTLLGLFTTIAGELRAIGLEKTGGKASDDPKVIANSKYGYFEEAEIATHLTVLLGKHKIGYAAGTSAVTGNLVTGKTNSGGDMRSHEVKSAAIFSHADSKDWIIVPGVGEAFDAGDKGITKAITSAIKYIWMKSFLISEGNDIEVEQGVRSLDKSKSRTAENVICTNCNKPVGVVMKGKDVVMTIAEVVEKGKKKFNAILCYPCCVEANKKDAKETTKEPEVIEGPKGGKKYITDGILEAKPRKRSVGKDKKPVYDLKVKLPKGNTVGISDWHESHAEFYAAAKGDEHIKLVITAAEGTNNATVVALMEFADEVIETQKGEKVQPDLGTPVDDEPNPFTN